MHRIEHAAGPFGHPAFGVVAYVGAMWLWHVPALYNAALEHGAIHVLERLRLPRAAGLLYWWHLLSPIRSRMRLGGMGPIIYMASTKILVGFLGILLTFSSTVLYDYYETGGTRWGLSALDDQHVAGLTMALEQSLVMGVALAYLFVRMLSESEAEDQRAERYAAVGLALGQHAQVARRAPGDPAEHQRDGGEADHVQQRTRRGRRPSPGGPRRARAPC